MSQTSWMGPAVLEDYQKEFHIYAINRGFWEHDDGSHVVDSEKIALMHSELSEALSELRDGNMEGVQDELADCVIRILDYLEARNLSLWKGISNAREKNDQRERLHGRNW